MANQELRLTIRALESQNQSLQEEHEKVLARLTEIEGQSGEFKTLQDEWQQLQSRKVQIEYELGLSEELLATMKKGDKGAIRAALGVPAGCLVA